MLAKKIAVMYVGGFRLFVVKNLHKLGMYIFCKKCSSKISYVNSILHI